ncbi:MAG: B12-binding domain-containing radical SAM protein [bacterium]|nr:B12-binding domain-containing radical SAM protein [bacterium]
MRKLNVALVRLLGVDSLERPGADISVGIGYLSIMARSLPFVELDIFDSVSPVDFDRIGNNYDCVGFTVHALNVDTTLSIIKDIKLRNPNTIIVVGGHHVSLSADELLEDYEDFIDVVCIGDGENTWLSVLKEIYDGKLEKGKRFSQGIDIKDLPLQNYAVTGTTARMITSKGCPFSCSFCTTPAMRKLCKSWKHYTIRLTVEVEREVRRLMDRGVGTIYINDDLYSLNKDRAMGIARIVPKGINYKVELRVDSIDDFETVLRLKQSGLCRVFFGIEAGEASMLDTLNKGFSRETAYKAVNMFKAAGILVNAGTIMSTPDSTVRNVIESIMFFDEMDLAYSFLKRVTCKVVVFPGTELESKLNRESRLERLPSYRFRKFEGVDPVVDKVTTKLEGLIPIFNRKYGNIFSQYIPNLAMYTLPKGGEGIVAAERSASAVSKFSERCAQMLVTCFKNPGRVAHTFMGLMCDMVDIKRELAECIIYDEEII